MIFYMKYDRFFNALGSLESQLALLVMISNSQDSTSMKSKVENFYLVLKQLIANKKINYHLFA